MKTILSSLIALYALSACSTTPPIDDGDISKPSTDNVSFTAVADKFKRENKDRRKWDAPVIADLDQDGYPDLIINDHGYGIRVMWNNKGSFAKPYDLIMGDIHGVAIGDINQDGKLEILVARGGGSGTNARNAKVFTAQKNRSFDVYPEFETPLALMRGRTLKLVDLDNDGDLDLINFAFPSKEKQGKSENYIYENNGKGNLAINNVLPAIKSDGQKTLVSDFNNDNVFDLVIYGHGALKVFQGNGDLTFTQVSNKVLPTKIQDVTAIVELDYDNDGDFDLYISRGKEFNRPETFYNPETQNWSFFNMRGNFDFELVTGEEISIENLQTPWPHKTFFIGESSIEYSFPGETHSGRTVSLVSSDALGFPDQIPDKGLYIGYIGNDTWKVAGNIFSQHSLVVNGVESYPSFQHDEGINDILLENRQGKFIDVSEQLGLLTKNQSTGVTSADINNDSYTDLIVSQRGLMVEDNVATVLLNLSHSSGERYFMPVKQHGIVTKELGAIGLSLDNLDYDLDGDIDIAVGNERGKWHLFENDQHKRNNYIKVSLPIANPDSPTSVGALVTVIACGITQQQRVGATGAAYSSTFNNLLHFGLEQCTKPVDIKVTWSNNEISYKHSKQINTIITIEN